MSNEWVVVGCDVHTYSHTRAVPRGSPTIIILALIIAHVISDTRPSPFSACNIEKWVWPGDKAR